MAQSSTMLALGTPCPDFALPDARTGAVVRRADFDGKPALLVMFICNHCPYVVHVMDELGRLARDYMQPDAKAGVGIVAINANSAKTHPQDGPPNMARLASERGWAFPFVFDDAQDVARAFQAACTPEFYVFDGARKLVYRGQLDGARPKNDAPVDGRHVRAALDAVLAGQTVPGEQIPSVGCNIKWHPSA